MKCLSLGILGFPTQKTVEKVSKYVDLKIEICRLWNMQVTVVPIIIGALGSIPHSLAANLKKLNIPDFLISLLQQTVLYSTALLLNHYLNI